MRRCFPLLLLLCLLRGRFGGRLGGLGGVFLGRASAVGGDLAILDLEDVIEIVPPPLPLLYDPFTSSRLTVPGEVPVNSTRVVGETSAFKTSTGFEVRFMMPVLNVPFRLIGAYNPQREGVLDNQLQPAKRFTFRFAVGTTF